MTTIQWATVPGYQSRKIIGIAGDPATDEAVRDLQSDGVTVEWFTRPAGKAWDGDELSARDRELIARARREGVEV